MRLPSHWTWTGRCSYELNLDDCAAKVCREHHHLTGITARCEHRLPKVPPTLPAVVFVRPVAVWCVIGVLASGVPSRGNSPLAI